MFVTGIKKAIQLAFCTVLSLSLVVLPVSAEITPDSATVVPSRVTTNPSGDKGARGVDTVVIPDAPPDARDQHAPNAPSKDLKESDMPTLRPAIPMPSGNAPHTVQTVDGPEQLVNPTGTSIQPESTVAQTPIPPITIVTPMPASVPLTQLERAPLVGGAELTVQCPGASLDDTGVIVVDNDEAKEFTLYAEEFQWQEIPDEQGRTHISAGAKFPVRVLSQLTSKTAKIGDPVEGFTKIDLKIGGRMIAPKGTKVIGHVHSVSPARRMLIAEFSKNRWMRANGMIGLQFDEIITATGDHLPLVAAPARQARIVDNRNEGRLLGVNHNGEVATPLSSQLKAQALHLAIRAGCSAAGVFSFGAVPIAYGVVGAINPSFAFLHPVGKNVPHRRLKGFAMGVVSGVPGGFLIADTVIKGAEAQVLPGDEFLVEFKENFTGEAATEAQLLPNAKTKVHGEIVDIKKSDKKKR